MAPLFRPSAQSNPPVRSEDSEIPENCASIDRFAISAAQAPPLISPPSISPSSGPWSRIGVLYNLSRGSIANGVVSNFVSSATYTPAGHLLAAQEGGGSTGFPAVTITNAYNNRLQPTLLSAAQASGTITSHLFCYSNCPGGSQAGNNGNLMVDTNNLNAALSATYTYDTLDRLAKSTATAWSDTYTYDPFGNLTNMASVPGYGPGVSFTSTATTNNQISGVGLNYDPSGAGYVLGDNRGNYGTFDAEGRVITTHLATGGTETYGYDGDGNRVLKYDSSNNGSTYWYGADGTVTDEQSLQLSGSNPAQILRNLYFNGTLAMRMGSDETFWPSMLIVPDQLGSSRATVGLIGGAGSPS